VRCDGSKVEAEAEVEDEAEVEAEAEVEDEIDCSKRKKRLGIKHIVGYRGVLGGGMVLFRGYARGGGRPFSGKRVGGTPFSARRKKILTLRLFRALCGSDGA
jgi:hypothetical protein